MRSRESKKFYLFVAIFTSLFVTPMFGQNATDDVKVRLSLPGEKSAYRIGEPIHMTLTFTSDADGYQLNTTTTKPASPVDEILLTPEEGATNWLAESLITKDHAVGILVKLAGLKQYADECSPLLIEQLIKSPNNQFPMYAEKSLVVITGRNKKRFQEVMEKRIAGLEKESQKKRVMKVLKKVESL